jgi:hypothetical protein
LKTRGVSQGVKIFNHKKTQEAQKIQLLFRRKNNKKSREGRIAA